MRGREEIGDGRLEETDQKRQLRGDRSRKTHKETDQKRQIKGDSSKETDEGLIRK